LQIVLNRRSFGLASLNNVLVGNTTKETFRRHMSIKNIERGIGLNLKSDF